MTETSKAMLEWQYRTLLGELQQLQLHASDPSCPCKLADIGEYCLPKHALNVATLATETAAMDKTNTTALFFELAESATELHETLKAGVCGEGNSIDVVSWSRQWRKKIEPLYYACDLKQQTNLEPITQLQQPDCTPHHLPSGFSQPPTPGDLGSSTSRTQIEQAGEACELISLKYRHLLGFLESGLEQKIGDWHQESEQKIDQVLARLDAGIKSIHEADNFRQYLLTMAKFHNYSIANIMLIALQFPRATRVAGFVTWKELRRYVKKGEKGIAILAPCFPPKPKKLDEGEAEPQLEPKPIYFRVVHVFDISQTGGKELLTFEVPILTGEATGPLYKRIESYAAAQGIRIDRSEHPELSPDMMGYWNPHSNEIWIRPGVPQEQATKTALHEFAHALCVVRRCETGRAAEAIAESTAYVVGAHFGFDTGARSFPYVAIWAQDIEILRRNLSTICTIAKDMIDGIEALPELASPGGFVPCGASGGFDKGFCGSLGRTGGDGDRLAAPSRSITVRGSAVKSLSPQGGGGWVNRKGGGVADRQQSMTRMVPCHAGEPRWCHGIQKADREVRSIAKSLNTAKARVEALKPKLEIALNICAGQTEMFQEPPRIDPYGSRCRDLKTGLWVSSEECGFAPESGVPNITWAMGAHELTRYEFRFKIIDASKLIVSHDPHTFEPNSKYPAELQPRLRERAATKSQVLKIAQNLDPDSLITDFHVLDRGAPIVGSDNVVESGNGRTMAIMLAIVEFPDVYAEYRSRLLERVAGLGLRKSDVEKIKHPVLVRERISDVDRVAFTQEANTAVSIAPSAVEQARTDAAKITMDILEDLVIPEDMSFEDALRQVRNIQVVRRFLAKLPEQEQARLVDAHGVLNQDGIRRTTMAIFASVFLGDAGLRLAELAFESMDMEVRNLVNAISRSLGPLAKAEGLIRNGNRRVELSISDDLARVSIVFASIKRTPELTVEKYIAQGQMFERELTDFEEGILQFVGKNARAPKRIAAVIRRYAELVVESPPPTQIALIPEEVLSKEEIWQSAIRQAEAEPVTAPALFQVCNSGGIMNQTRICGLDQEQVRVHITGKCSGPSLQTCKWRIRRPAQKVTVVEGKSVAVDSLEELPKTLETFAVVTPIKPQETVAELPPSTPEAVEPVKELPKHIKRIEEDQQEKYIRMLRKYGFTVAYPVKLGAMTRVPIYEDHPRGRNWLAKIRPSPTAPGGLEREFVPRGKGKYIYMVEDHLSIGDAVEFGADYYSGSGRRSAKRWYGVVASVMPDKIFLVPQDTADEALRLAEEVQPYVGELRQDPILAEIASQICTVGLCNPDSEKPICSSNELKKLERCITKVKARNVEAGYPPEGTGSRKAPNPWAVCSTAIGCRPGRKGEV
jgi:hypothetical protein